MPSICVLGATGVGKGSTLNSCFRSEQFGTSSMFASDTIKPISFMLPWRGDGEIMRGVDLCGFSDSEGRDTGFIEEMVAYLREEVRQVNCFLLLLNSQEPRIGAPKGHACRAQECVRRGVHAARPCWVHSMGLQRARSNLAAGRDAGDAEQQRQWRTARARRACARVPVSSWTTR